MKKNILWTLVLGCMLTPLAMAQEEKKEVDEAAVAAAEAAAEAARKAKTDAVNDEASKLEAELGKYKDISPEAAEAMVKLVDLYHVNGRVFGVIRVARRFVAAHTTDPRHGGVMLKLIDALEVAARQNDLVTACRQYLGRYSDTPECASVELRLTQTLVRQGKAKEAAEAYAAAWKRQPNAAGRHFGVAAVRRHIALNNAPSFATAAEISEQMMTQAGKSPFGEFVGLLGVDAWERASQWAKANVVANKMIKLGLPVDKGQQLILLEKLATNYGKLGQWANSAEYWKKVRALQDSANRHYSQVTAMYNATPNQPKAIAGEVTQFTQKYPQDARRYGLQTLLASAYIASADKPGAAKILAQLLPFNATTGSNAQRYVQNNGDEPAKLAETERVLKDAISKNKDLNQQTYLRYVLAFDLYRDRMKNPAKVMQTMRELVVNSPDNSGWGQQAVNWLLSQAASEAEFKANVALAIKSRRDFVQFTSYTNRLAEWAAGAKKSKDKALKQRAAFVAAELAKANSDPLIKGWASLVGTNNAKGSNFRISAVASPAFAKLNDSAKNTLLYYRAYNHRHYAATNLRAKSVDYWIEFLEKFPNNGTAAYGLLEAAHSYSTPAQAHEFVPKVIASVGSSNNQELYRYLMYAADRSLDKTDDTEDVKKANFEKNKALVKQVFAFITKSEKEFGNSYTYAASFGDTLLKYGLEAEALAYWKSHAVPTTFYGAVSSDMAYCSVRAARNMPDAQKVTYLRALMGHGGLYYGRYAEALAGHYLNAGDLANFEKVLQEAAVHQAERASSGSGFEYGTAAYWMAYFGGTAEEPKELTDEDKLRFLKAIVTAKIYHQSALAELALLAATPADTMSTMERLQRYYRATLIAGNAHALWDQVMPYMHETLARKEYLPAATLLTGMLANVTNVDEGRRKPAREMVAQSYSRIGTVGLTIDDSSPVAPLLRAALMLRLGDDRLAFETYTANVALFDEHQAEMPVDFILFVCDNHIAAGGDENFDRVEEILRGWIVRNSEAKQIEDTTKAKVQLMLAKNFFNGRRFDIARSEYTTVKNRYPETREAIEAEFGIGETFMAQKVYDQAESVFEKLSNSRETEVVVRAEFLRGVLAYRRGDLDEARGIFRGVLERVPNIDLANNTLFNLSEVYGSEERYTDQLSLLQTVGRLGKNSKRWHKPGVVLSIVVQDTDLGISRGHSKIPVVVRTEPGGDEETIFLTSGGAGKGLFRADLQTELGTVSKGDNTLQLTGNDVIKSDYPDSFKADFKQIPLSDVDIRIASNAEFEVASSLIIDEDEETFTEKLEREAAEKENQDERVSQGRPTNQVKPGNRIYMRVKDADRDLSDEADKIVVKLTAQSGDEVQVALEETGLHTGIFEASAVTGELPAGAVASDQAIQHIPLMAIDRDPESFWQSEPDGATPKELTVDMKDLKLVARVRVSAPDPNNQAPVRGELYGSNDGEFWFRLASNPALPPAIPVAGEFGKMKRRVYEGNYSSYTTWNQVVDLTKNGTAISEDEVEDLQWALPEDVEEEAAKKQHGVIWNGKLVQPRSGAMRITVSGVTNALVLDGRLELPVGKGARTVDVWLESGVHDLTVFSAVANGVEGVEIQRARANLNSRAVSVGAFRAVDFDLEQPAAGVSAIDGLDPDLPKVITADGDWEFRFSPIDLRYVRFVVNEYLGDAVAISNVEIRGEEDDQLYIPTETDVLALANNEILEIAGGDIVTATYTDDRTQSEQGQSRLLTKELQATYFDAGIAPIAYDFVENSNGTVNTIEKELMRIDPGERFIVEIVDYDQDQTDEPDTIKFQVMVNDGKPIELIATETEPYSGIFTKEVDSSETEEEGKLQVKQGDRIYCRYIDTQNTFPGHSVPRESVLYVREPTEGRVQILESRFTPPNEEAGTRGQSSIFVPDPDAEVSSVAFEVPLTVEVIDLDAAKDSRSSVNVTVTTTDGVKVDVKCDISDEYRDTSQVAEGVSALEQGRFVGQVILQLGGKDSPQIVPLAPEMPRSLIGGPISEEEQGGTIGESLVTTVLNVTGKDLIASTYKDELRPGGEKELQANGRLITNGLLRATDRDYDNDVAQLHVGEKLFLLVADADQDTTDERDTVAIEITSENGENETVQLEETLAHSGIFSGSLSLKATEKATPENLDPENPVIETYFGDTITTKYIDRAASTESGELESIVELPVVIGTDGLVAAFSKTFNDEHLAVETKFHIAESYFELFKSHKDLGRDEEQKSDLKAGRRVLREVMEDYPDPKYVPRIAYLLGQFAQELGQWREAIDAYELITRQYAEHNLAPDAQYKLAQCYEESGDFPMALEAYVTLAATYPKNPLIASVMIRISDYFYKAENYEVAAQVGKKFLERFEAHQHAARIAFRVGQSYYKGKFYKDASNAFDTFAKKFPDDQLCADALFWSGESHRMGGSATDAFRRYNRCRWDFPASEAAKYARGRLTLPEMLRQFEAEATALEMQ